MRALVLGNGSSGRAAAEALRRSGAEVTVLDADAPFPEGEYACAVVSPGVALTHPWIAACRERGIPYRSELQVGCELLRAQGVKLLAVTGSKGKSSVVKVVAEAIGLAGLRAVPCGNYGLSVCQVALDNAGSPAPLDWAVVEVSSFMMETTDLPADTFEAAAVLNLQEDHLDRHGDVVTYHRLKRLLLTMTPTGYDYSRATGDFAEGFWRRLANRFFRMADASAPAGSYFDNEVLRVNGVAAAQLMYEAGVPYRTIRRAFLEFKPLPHRMNVVAEIDGVRYIDDSKATSLAALGAGVVMASARSSSTERTIRLIAGGLPKGDDPKSVIPILTTRVKKVYIIGNCAEAFYAAWHGAVDCEICEVMAKAVEAAKREAEKGDTVLLSPGTASFDQFKSFGERGEVFAGLVKKEREDK